MRVERRYFDHLFDHLNETAATFTQAISFNPRFYFPRLNLGVVYSRQGNFGEAIKVLDKLAQEQPSLANARIQLAEALVGLAQTEAAAEQLRLALADKNLDSATRAEAHFKF